MADRSDTPRAPEPSATPAAKGPRTRGYPRERAVVTVLFFAAAIGQSLYSAAMIHAETFRTPAAGASAPAPCSRGVRELYAGYARALATTTTDPQGALRPRAPLREAGTAATLAGLDESLRALAATCAAEGPAAREAHAALEVWRHQAEDLTRLAERVLAADAERALRYESPPQRSP